jgi:hypothetical protein
MAITLDIYPEEPIAVVSACKVDVAGAADTDSATYDEDALPTEESIPYRIIASNDDGDHEDLVSHEFVVSADGNHRWDNIIFPVDGSWTLDLVDQRNDSVAATLAVEVSA